MNKRSIVVATIEARMGSTRLPEKVLLPIMGRPMLLLMLERVKRAKLVDEIVVATTTKPDDDKIAKLAKKERVSVFRGSEEDVLKRVVQAAKKFGAGVVVRLTADCPVVDWRIIDRLVRIYQSENYDYVSNVIKRSFPLGLDVEVLSFKKLQEIEKIATGQVYREHPPYYFYVHPRQFRLKNWQAKGKMHWPDLRVTLDTKEDYLVLTKIFEELYPQNPDFSAEDVVELMRRHPEWVAINSQIKHRHLPRP